MGHRTIVVRAARQSRLTDAASVLSDRCGTTYLLAVDGSDRVAVSADRSHPPGVMFGESHVARWAEGSIATLDLVTGRPQPGSGTRRETRWPIPFATTAWTADFSRRLAGYDHRGVVVDPRWDGHDLVVGDWAGGVARLRGPTLARV